MNIAQKNNLATIFNALGDPTRLKIIQMLLKSPDFCVGELAKATGVSASAVSQHCRLLEQSGILMRDRRGQQTCFQINDNSSEITTIIELVKENS